jgi:hypothetical protein
MLGNEQLVCASFAQHVQPDQYGRDDHRVRPIYPDRLYWMETLDRLPTLLGKAHITANVPGGAARFNTMYDVAFRQVLVIQIHRRLHKNPSLLERIERTPWQP